jgi:hypothetical protein
MRGGAGGIIATGGAISGGRRSMGTGRGGCLTAGGSANDVSCGFASMNAGTVGAGATGGERSGVSGGGSGVDGTTGAASAKGAGGIGGSGTSSCRSGKRDWAGRLTSSSHGLGRTGPCPTNLTYHDSATPIEKRVWPRCTGAWSKRSSGYEAARSPPIPLFDSTFRKVMLLCVASSSNRRLRATKQGMQSTWVR